MAEVVRFVVAILFILCGSSTLVMSAVKFMSQYVRVDNDFIASITISMVGGLFSSSFGQCASACNLHGNGCRGYMFQTSPCTGTIPTNIGYCQLVASVNQASSQRESLTECRHLYINNDYWMTATSGEFHGWLCIFDRTSLTGPRSKIIKT